MHRHLKEMAVFRYTGKKMVEGDKKKVYSPLITSALISSFQVESVGRVGGTAAILEYLTAEVG